MSSLTLDELADALTSGRTTSRKLVEDALQRIADTSGEGARVFISVDVEGARLAADAMDNLRRANAAPTPYAGIPISVKDLFDIAGQSTRAGSRVGAQAPAATDAAAVARLRAAGFVVIGRTNMTEFAFSGLGINPHYGTPANPWDRASRRIPGGSSSGAAVSVTDGFAHAALGTDTGGSCRIPAALTGIVGFKPTQSRVPLAGTIPLSSTLDSVGPLARTVACCSVIDAILSGTTRLTSAQRPRLHIAVLKTLVLDGLDEVVSADFERALSKLSAAGVQITDIAVPEIAEIPDMNAKGGFAAAESYAWHREPLQQAEHLYDPRVAIRIRRGMEQSAADYIQLQEQRRKFIGRFNARLAPFDAYLCPTVPIVAPRLGELSDDATYTRVNLLTLRNPTVVNMADGCSISIPMHKPGCAPTGIMLSALTGQDERLLLYAAHVEAALR